MLDKRYVNCTAESLRCDKEDFDFVVDMLKQIEDECWHFAFYELLEFTNHIYFTGFEPLHDYDGTTYMLKGYCDAEKFTLYFGHPDDSNTYLESGTGLIQEIYRATRRCN